MVSRLLFLNMLICFQQSRTPVGVYRRHEQHSRPDPVSDDNSLGCLEVTRKQVVQSHIK